MKKQDFHRSHYGFEIVTTRRKRHHQERTPAFSLSHPYRFDYCPFDITKGQSKYYGNIIGFKFFLLSVEGFLVLDYQLHLKCFKDPCAVTAGETALVLISILQESRKQRNRSLTCACF